MKMKLFAIGVVLMTLLSIGAYAQYTDSGDAIWTLGGGSSFGMPVKSMAFTPEFGGAYGDVAVLGTCGPIELVNVVVTDLAAGGEWFRTEWQSNVGLDLNAKWTIAGQPSSNFQSIAFETWTGYDVAAGTADCTGAIVDVNPFNVAAARGTPDGVHGPVLESGVDTENVYYDIYSLSATGPEIGQLFTFFRMSWYWYDIAEGVGTTATFWQQATEV